MFNRNLRKQPNGWALPDNNFSNTRPMAHPVSRQTVPSFSISNQMAMVVPTQFSSQNVRKTVPGQSLSLSSYQNGRKTIHEPPSRRLSNPHPIIHEQFFAPVSRQNIRQPIPPSSYVPNDKPMPGTRYAPIDIPDSPTRENSRDHRGQRAKRGREVNSEFEICSDSFSKLKRAKMMHQSQNQSINSQQNESKLPSLQNNSHSTNRIAALYLDRLLDQMLATTTVEGSTDDFFLEGETIHDFIGMEELIKVALFRNYFFFPYPN